MNNCKICNNKLISIERSEKRCEQDNHSYYLYFYLKNEEIIQSHSVLSTKYFTLYVYKERVSLYKGENVKFYYWEVPNFKIKPKHINIINIEQDLDKLLLFK